MFWSRVPPVLLLLFAGCASAVAGVPEGYVSEVLPNGLRVSVLPDPNLTVVATQVWYHVGSANEDEGSRGLAHLFEHLMFGETTTRDGRDFADYHHRHGGYENAYTSPDETVYVSEIAPEHFGGVLEREADRMVNLVLTEENLQNEIRIVTEELRLVSENDPLSRMFHQATRALLGEHPYAVWPSGTKEDIAAATVESCRKFYERFYGPSNAHLVISGPVDGPSTLALVAELFGPLEGGGAPAADVTALDDWQFPAQIDLREDLPPVEVAILGFPLPPPDSDDAVAVGVMTAMLAGAQVDPFREELVRRRHKAVDAGTVNLLLRRGGALAFYSVHVPYRRKKTAFRLMEQTQGVLSGMEWLDEGRLAAAKRSLLRGSRRNEYFAGRMSAQIGQARWWLDDESVVFERDERIAAVTLEDVRRAWSRYVGDRTGVRLYVRPEKVPLWIRLFGWLYPLVD